MRKESLHIAIACFIGGMLGVLTGVTIAKTFGFAPYAFMWYIAGCNGAFVGGIAAYFAYQPSVVLSALRRAWYEIADTERLNQWGMAGLRGVWTVVLVAATFVAAGTSFAGIIYLGITVDAHLYGTAAAGENSVGTMFALALITFLMINTYMCIFEFVPRRVRPMVEKLQESKYIYSMIALLALAMNPVMVALAIPYRL